MIPKDHGFGTSFKGVAQYLLHDKDHADTNDRVAWTHVEGLATDDAQTAFRVMAATAMDAERIKRQHHEAEMAKLPEEERRPFRNAGRKSDKSVWHFSLSWHPDEAQALTREQMIDAARSSLKQLGKGDFTADQLQAVFVCHEDEKHPHVHVVVNRVHPEHGRMISKFNDWKRFSRWAQAYEEERGHVFCHQRRANNMTRDMGGHVYGKGSLPHHISTADRVQRNAINDNDDHLARVQAEQRQKTADLAQRGRAQAKRHLDELRARQEAYIAEKREARAAAAKPIAREKAKIFAAFQPYQQELLELHELRVADFEKRERDMFGKARNMFDAVKATWSVQRAGDRPVKLSDYYRPFSGEGARLEAMKELLRSEQRQLEIEREKQHGAAMSRIAAERIAKIAGAREAYAADRDHIVSEQREERLALKADWKTRHVEQHRAIEAVKMAGIAKVKRTRDEFMRRAKSHMAKDQIEAQAATDADNRAAHAAPTHKLGDAPEHIRRAKEELKAKRERDETKARDRSRERNPYEQDDR